MLRPYKREIAPRSYWQHWRIWKQGELGYSCGGYALLTAAYNLADAANRQEAYDSSDLKKLRMTGKIAKAFLSTGLSRKHLLKLALNVNLEASRVRRDTIAPTSNLLFAVCLKVAFRDRVDTWRKCSSYGHWVLLIDETDTGFVVADSHPWNPSFWSLSRTELKHARAVKGCGAIAIRRKST